MNIKITKLVLIILLWNQPLHSQCKLDKKKDDFSSRVTVSTKELTIIEESELFKTYEKPWNIDISFHIVDSAISFILTHHSKGGWVMAIEKVIFKFDDGLLITKGEMLKNVKSEFNEDKYSLSVFRLTKEELMRFSNNKVTKMQITFFTNTDPIYEKELKDKISAKLKEMSSCILTEVK